MTVFKQVESLHGRDVLNDLKHLETTRIKIAQKSTNMEFLKRCRDNEIIPQFATVKHRLNNCRNQSLFKHFSISLIRQEIKKFRGEIHSLSEKACRLHIRLANTINSSLWNAVDSAICMRCESHRNRSQPNKTVSSTPYTTRRSPSRINEHTRKSLTWSTSPVLFSTKTKLRFWSTASILQSLRQRSQPKN